MLHPRVLGQLDDDAVEVRRVGERIADGGVGQHGGGDVDGEEGVGGQLAARAERQPDRERLELGSAAVRVRRVDPLGRGGDRVAGEAQQRLVPGDLAALEVHDRLEVDRHALAAQRAREHAHPVGGYRGASTDIGCPLLAGRREGSARAAALSRSRPWSQLRRPRGRVADQMSS